MGPGEPGGPGRWGFPGPGWGPGPVGPSGVPRLGWSPGPWGPGFGPGGFAAGVCDTISACLSCLCCCWLLGDCFGLGGPRGFEPPPLPPPY